MKVHEVLEAKGAVVITAEPDCPLSVAARALAERNIGALVVMDEQDLLIGILSERDIVRAFALGGTKALAGNVRDYMSKDVITCQLDDTCRELMGVMTRHRIRHIPVLAKNEVVGIISIGDVVKHRVEEVETEANVLRDYVMAR